MYCDVNYHFTKLSNLFTNMNNKHKIEMREVDMTNDDSSLPAAGHSWIKRSQLTSHVSIYDETRVYSLATAHSLLGRSPITTATRVHHRRPSCIVAARRHCGIAGFSSMLGRCVTNSGCFLARCATVVAGNDRLRCHVARPQKGARVGAGTVPNGGGRATLI